MLTYLKGWVTISGTSHSIDELLKKCGTVEGDLIGSKLVIFDIKGAKCIFSAGFFGKPVGIRKPKSLEIDRPLELSLIEGVYLAEKGVLRVRKEGREVALEELIKYSSEVIEDFQKIYEVYRELRDRGLIVRSALKYGADFAVYRRRPGLEHAPFLVKVLSYDQVIDPGDLVGWGRVSHSVRKELLIAVIYPSNAKKYIMFKWLKP